MSSPSLVPSKLRAWLERRTAFRRAIRNGETETPLHNAVLKRDLSHIQKLLDEQVEIDALDKNHMTPLMKAIAIGPKESNRRSHETRCKIIELLVKNGANIHDEQSGLTPLELAIQNTNIKYIKRLLKNSTNLNPEDKLNKLLFNLATNTCISSEDRTSIAKLLLYHGAIPIACYSNGITPLHFAGENEDVAFAKLLIDNNNDVNAIDDRGETPLHRTVRIMIKGDVTENQIAIVNLLLEMGADPNIYDLDGFTPLHRCMGQEYEYGFMKHEARSQVVENFLRHGADFNAATIIDGARGHELLFLATRTKCGISFMEYLLTKGADINAGHNYKSTPLYAAAENGDEESVRFLLDNGAKMYPEGPNDESILAIAVESGCPMIVELILKFCYTNSESTAYKVPMKLWSLGAERFFVKLETWLENRAGNNDGITENQYRTVLNNLLQDAYNYDNTLDIDDESDYDDSDEDLDGMSCNSPDNNISTEFDDELEIVKLLLSNRIYIDFRDDGNRTSLGYAIKYDDVEITKLCLASQTKVDINDFKVAVVMGRRNVVETLLMHDPSIDLNAPSDETLCHAAMGKYDFPFVDEPDLIIDNDAKHDIARLLVSKGANYIWSRKGSALSLAAKNNLVKLVEFLVKYNALFVRSPLDEEKRKHDAVIHGAARYDHLDTVKVLLKYGVHVDETYSHGYTAFDIACRKGYAEMAEFLLESGASLRKNVDDIFLGSSGCPAIRAIIGRHIVQTISLRGRLSGAALRQYQEITSNQALSEFLEKCEEEAARMRNKIIGGRNVCCYDIVEKGRDQLTRYARNESICEAMRSSDLAREFPLHYGAMILNFLKGQKRVSLIDSGKKIIHSIGGCELMPEPPIDHLFSYLDDEDLKNLIKACSQCDL